MRGRVLILGGTGEARALALRAKRLGYAVTTALAGRTHGAARVAGRVRRGGFGGAAGLARHLRRARADWLIDATHPFAIRISAAARQAARATGTRLLRLERPRWTPGPGDRWHDAADAADAALIARGLGGRVFLTIGRTGLAAFDGLDCVVRAIEPFAVPIANARLILGRGPFTPAGEARIFRDHAIGVLVTKASGGAATQAKLIAARALGLPVVMIRRPADGMGLDLDAIVAALKRSNSKSGRARLSP